MQDHFMYSPDDSQGIAYWTEECVDGIKTEKYMTGEEIIAKRAEIAERSRREGFFITKSAHTIKRHHDQSLPNNFIWWYPEQAAEFRRK